ncbi:MAG: hypothetical protein AAF569_05785 [Pseudomonadota bacterium]
MVVYIENQDISADIHLHDTDGLHVNFADPAYVRSDMIIVHSSNAGRKLGAVLHEGYYEIGALPQSVSIESLESLDTVRLQSILPCGKEFKLTAPLIVK